MRKFLMVAAVVAVAACGKKQGDTSAEAMGAAAGAAVDTAAHKADSAMGAMADSAHAAMVRGWHDRSGDDRHRQDGRAEGC